MLIEQDNFFYPIEIKRSAAPKEEDVKTFRLLQKMGVTTGKGAIVCLYENLLPLNRDVQIIPVGYLGYLYESKKLKVVESFICLRIKYFAFCVSHYAKYLVALCYESK